MFKFTLKKLLGQTISIASPTVTQGTNIPSAKKGTWTTTHSGIQASVQPASGEKRELFGKLDMKISHEIVTQDANVTTIQNGYRVSDGTNNYVVKHFENQAGRDLVYCVYVDQILGD